MAFKMGCFRCSFKSGFCQNTINQFISDNGDFCHWVLIFKILEGFPPSRQQILQVFEKATLAFYFSIDVI